MSFLRGLWIDLVDKRLWPVALGLLVAAVAVPMALHRGADATPTAPVPSAASVRGPGALPSPAVSLATDKPGGVLVGSEHNPFRPQHVPHAPKGAGLATATAGTSVPTGAASPAGGSTPAGSAGGPSGSSGGPSGGSGSGAPGGSTGTPHRPPPHVPQTYVRVRFGEFGHGLGGLEVAALKPLPPTKHPFLVYLGQAGNGRTAVFSVSALAQPASHASGGASDGVCRPTRAECRTIHMNPGDRVDFTVTASKGTTVTHYRLIVTGYTTR